MGKNKFAKTAEFPEWVRLMRVKNSRSYRRREKEQKERVTIDKEQEKEKDIEMKHLQQQVKRLQEILEDANSRERSNLEREERNKIREREIQMRLGH